MEAGFLRTGLQLSYLLCTLAVVLSTVTLWPPVVHEFHDTLRPLKYFFMAFTHPTVVSNQTRAPTVFELMQFHENKIMEKLFKKIPIQPCPGTGKEIFRHLDIYNRCFLELVKRFSKDRNLYSHQALIVKRQLGPLALQEYLDEEKIRIIYSFNDKEIELLHSKLNTTRATWEKLQIFFDRVLVTIDKPI